MKQSDLNAVIWQRSSYSSGNGQCVEVAQGFTGVVPVRDSKHPGPAITVRAGAWDAFIAHLKAHG
ncbi:DUF397 domain-containing protein [Streptomyces harbinensis]|uniref:DUF397 domain-containing protein n=1 Tax=Streptomyces harbinensis TaxID=1176198 RepID=A0A1I6TZV3_9ACTN|nr:DUF397 domain-containing protein [Streptomyces harbinensis]SFS94674.1 protein of unknown function [Streptomyces harbinensis]